MNRVLRCSSLIGALMLGMACGTNDRRAQSGPDRTYYHSAAAPTPPPPLPVGEPAGTYVFSGHWINADWRFHLRIAIRLVRKNGVFGLRYDAFAHVYLGTYRQDDATITFRFDGGDQGFATGDP